jgi:hypothetical protein
LAHQQWWRAYGDPQLDRWIDLAVQGSPSMAMAAARVREAKAMAGVVESAEAADQRPGHAQAPQLAEDQFYGPGALSGAHLGQQRRHGLQLRPGPVGP